MSYKELEVESYQIGDTIIIEKGPLCSSNVIRAIEGPSFDGEDHLRWSFVNIKVKVVKDTKIARTFYKNRIFAECEGGLLAVEI